VKLALASCMAVITAGDGDAIAKPTNVLKAYLVMSVWSHHDKNFSVESWTPTTYTRV
jgi:hypothetical protein